MSEISQEQISTAYGRIKPYIRKTPVLEVSGEPFGHYVPVCLKLECLQHAGSFKPRGAFNSLIGVDVPDAGVVAASGNPLFPVYTTRRAEVGGYRPWPEWVIPPIYITETNGTVVFNCMLSWWSRYIGISPYFEKPIRLTIEDCRIKKIEGGQEAVALKRFLEKFVNRIVYYRLISNNALESNCKITHSILMHRLQKSTFSFMKSGVKTVETDKRKWIVWGRNSIPYCERYSRIMN